MSGATEPLLGGPSSSEKKHILKEIGSDWKLHREGVLKEVFEMCDKDRDDKLAGRQSFSLYIAHVKRDKCYYVERVQYIEHWTQSFSAIL